MLLRHMIVEKLASIKFNDVRKLNETKVYVMSNMITKWDIVHNSNYFVL